MAHKTLIGGTSYDISGGKTLVNGTSYNIAGGKTLVNGVGYDISFGVDLAALFSRMTVLHVEGVNGRSKQGVNFGAGGYVGIGNTGYVFSFCGGDCSIFKVVVGQTITPIYQSSTSYAGLSMSYSGIIAYYHGVDTTPPGSSSYNTSSVYGATLALVQFDQPEAKVDAALSALQYVASDGVNASSSNWFYVNKTRVSIGDFVFVAQSNEFSINIRSSTNMPSLTNLISSSNVATPTRIYEDSSDYYYGGSSNYLNGRGTIHVVRGG